MPEKYISRHLFLAVKPGDRMKTHSARSRSLSFANNTAHARAKDREIVIGTTHTHIYMHAGFTLCVCETVGRISSVSSLIAVI